MKVLDFQTRIMKIMKIIEFHENPKIHRQNRKTHEYHRIPNENHENQKQNKHSTKES